MIDSYNDLPLGVYQEILVINADSHLDEIDKQVKIIALLSGMSESEVLDIPVTEYALYASKLAFLGEMPETPKRIAHSYNVGGFKLIPTDDLRKITAGQYIDFQTFAPQGDAKMAEILSVFLVPEGKKYNTDYDIGEVQNAVKEISVSEVLGLSAFFLKKLSELIKDSKTSLIRAWKAEKDPKRKEQIAEILGSLPSGNGYSI